MEAKILQDFNHKLKEINKKFVSEINTIQTGRAHPSILDGIFIELYETKMPLNQVASILTSEAAVLQITPFDTANIAIICKAISANEKLNLNPNDDGRVIYVPIPPLTTERRQQIVKNLHALREDFLIRIRQARHYALNTLKESFTAEDEIKRLTKQIETSAAETKQQIEELALTKEKEILDLK